MTIQELGSIGELVGAVAFLVTLVYLSMQMRQTRISAEETAYFARQQATATNVNMYSRWRQSLQNPHLAKILIKADRGEGLSAAEQVQLSSTFEELFAATWQAYVNTQPGRALYDASSDIDHLMDVLEAHPCGVAEWNRFRRMVARLSPELVAAVDSRIIDLPGNPNPTGK